MTLVVLVVVTIPPCGPEPPMWPPMPWANALPLAAKVTVATRAAATLANVLILVTLDLLSQAKHRALCDNSGDYRPCSSLVVGKITRVVD
jgi:hypothetical protein